LRHLFFRLWKYLTGYLVLRIEGFFSEKFINISTKRQINLWNIYRDNEGRLYARTGLKDFYKIRPVTFKSRCRVRIAKRVGLPFLIKRYRKRKAFAVGLLMCLLITRLMTSIIWTIDINADPSISSTRVYDYVRSMGVYPGVIKNSVDREKIAQGLVKDIKEIGWAGVSIKGTRLIINLAGRDPLPKLVPMDEPCNLVAAKDGVIKKVIALRGIDVVKPGDVVVKGQLLVSGSFVPKYNEGVLVKLHASGQVIAATWYKEERRIEMQEAERYRTGKNISNTTLEIFGLKIPLFHSKPEYALYETITESKTLSLTDKLRLPISIIKETYYENDVIIKNIDFEKAKENAILEAQRACLDKIPEEATIISEKTEFIPLDDGGLLVRVIIECEEDIGVEEELKEQNMTNHNGGTDS